MFETGLGRSALATLAAHPAATMVSDVVSASTYFEEDPSHQVSPDGAFQPLHASSGVGPWPEKNLLRMVGEGGPEPFVA